MCLINLFLFSLSNKNSKNKIQSLKSKDLILISYIKFDSSMPFNFRQWEFGQHDNNSGIALLLHDQK